MQGFIRLISKETVLLNVATKRSSVNKVGVKDQRITLRLICFSIAIYPCHLARCKENQSTLLVVVNMPTVYQITALYVFQENRVKAKIHARSLPGICLG